MRMLVAITIVIASVSTASAQFAMDHGHARNVLGGPLSALKNVVEVLAADRINPALKAGEFITTGTITRAFPIQRGEEWRSEFIAASFEGLTVRVV